MPLIQLKTVVFPGSVGPDDGIDLSLLHGEANAVERLQSSEADR